MEKADIPIPFSTSPAVLVGAFTAVRLQSVVQLAPASVEAYLVPLASSRSQQAVSDVRSAVGSAEQE